MNATNTVLVFLTVATAGIGPFIAVHIGGKAYGDMPKPPPKMIEQPEHDTAQITRVTVDPYHY